MSPRDCAIIGVGMVPFGKHQGESLRTLGARAIRSALQDAGIDLGRIDMAFMANAVAAVITGQVSVVGQVILDEVGIRSIPVYNVDNACASSSSALNLAIHAVRSGDADMVLVAGVEKLHHPERRRTYEALNGAADAEWVRSLNVDPGSQSVFVHEVYPRRLRSYAERFSLPTDVLAQIAVKNRRHATANPNAQYRDPVTAEEVLAAPIVTPPLTRLMCAPIGDGAAAAIVCGAETARAAHREPIWLLGSAVSMGGRPDGEASTIARTARRAYEQAGLGPEHFDVAEVHDATAFSELTSYEDLGFCAPGDGARLVDSGHTAIGGKLPVNPSGGLESRGHPVAATGLAQIAELIWQLRSEAGPRQVDGARIGLAQSAGGYVGGDSAAVAVHVLGR